MLFDFLTKTRTLCTLGILMALCLLSFLSVMLLYDFQIIDEMYNPDAVREHIQGMTPKQRHVHILLTATLDVLFPLIYGSLYAGLAWRSFGAGKGRLRQVLIMLPSVLVVPVDLTEGFLQVRALSGHDNAIVAKAWVTPAKLVLFSTASLIAVSALITLAAKPKQTPKKAK